MSLRIGFDLDGVLADMDGALARHAMRLFGGAVEESVEEDDGSEPGDPSKPSISRLRLSPQQQRRLWKEVEAVESFWERLQESEPGAVAALAALATARRWEIIFLTKRPRTAGATAQVQSQRWLQAKGFALPSVFVVQGSRGRIATALDLDVVVDDRPENCLDVVVDSQARAVLIARADARQPLPEAIGRLGVGVVSTVAECLGVLVQADEDAKPRPGVLGRVKQMFGMG
jgi:hypothetical protein